jgi:transposase
MRRVREIMGLHLDAGLSTREVARRAGVAPSTMREMVKRYERSGLAWPPPAEMSDEGLEALLYGVRGTMGPKRTMAEPDWRWIHRELGRKHVTLQVLWEEYAAAHPDGYKYSRFCELYRRWEGKLPLVMRQTYVGGEKLFVDYAGDTVTVHDRKAGPFQAHIFVAVMGASSLSFAWATRTETMTDFLDAHARAFAFFGGAPQLLVCDNAKVAVIRSCLYDPQVNRAYAQMARHYGTSVLPTRPRRPKDKAKVERAVLIVERWLFGRLRNVRFRSLAQLNTAIAAEMTKLNDHRVMRQYGKTRREMFETLDKPELRPLPAEPYEHAEWHIRKVNLDYHIEVRKHLYSVPYALAREQVDVRVTGSMVEIFRSGKRVAVHRRGAANGRHTTVPEHMPSHHRALADWTPERLVRAAGAIGANVAILCERIMAARAHREQAFRACRGIVSLGARFAHDRIDAAATRALAIEALNYPSLLSILEQGLEDAPVPGRREEHVPIEHGNIRGQSYYN